MASYLLTKQSTWGVGVGVGESYKVPAAVVGIFCYFIPSKLFRRKRVALYQAVNSKNCLHRYSSKIHCSLHLNRSSFQCFPTVLNSFYLRGRRMKQQDGPAGMKDWPQIST